ncbi:MAG: hypothetical protein PHP73_04915 [Candidatus Omnitrophica bacterium]|nr:hypothetical protein [Candidatus Omnitrophota bacterium]
MRQHLGFLKASSAVVKVAAWIFLFFGMVGGSSLLLGLVPNNPRWMGIIVLAFYMFMFFFFFLIAKIADLLIKIVNEIKKE